MRLATISEGEIPAAQDRIISVKSILADSLAAEISGLGFEEVRVEKPRTVSDDAIIYFEAGAGRLVHESQKVMVRIVSDDDLQINIPIGLADMLGVNDYYKESSAAEVMARLQKILL